jgi:hypothetical protein
MLLSFQIIDARGTPRRISPSLGQGLFGSTERGLDQLREYYRLQASLNSLVLKGIVWTFSSALMAVGVAVLLFAQLSLRERMVMFVPAVAVGLALPFYFRCQVRRRAEALVQRGVLRLRLCACCGADLSKCRFEDDACVVCPRCSAAWVPHWNVEQSEKFRKARV